MSTSYVIDPTQPLTPSELVLLNGEQFAKKVMLGNVQLLHSGASVSAAQLGQAILVAGFLAAESTANLRFEARQEKAMLGLRKVKNLYANPTPHPVEWPDGCLESRLPTLAERLKADQENHQVSRLIYTWLGEDSGSPWQSAIDLVKYGMAGRGLLDSSKEKKLKLFTVTTYTLPQSTASLAAQQSIESVKQLLSNCERSRPEIWDLLVKQIKKAISDRTEQDDYD
jgi:hypothetical protein